MTLVRAIASYLVDFYNPPGSSKQEQEARRKRGRYPAFSEIGKLIKLLSKGDNQDKSVLEVLFENYAKNTVTKTLPCETGQIFKTIRIRHWIR